MSKFRSSAFTLIELLVVITIIAILAGVAMPVIGGIQSRARGAQCLSQLQQIGTAARMYANDHDQTLPVTTHQRRQGGKSWSVTLQPYAAGTLLFRCPLDEQKTRSYSYVINDFLTPNPAGAPELDFSILSRLERLSETILFAEASKTNLNSDHFHFSDYAGSAMPPAIFASQVAVERHGKQANYVFADGHAETLSWKEVQERLCAPGNRFADPTAEVVGH